MERRGQVTHDRKESTGNRRNSSFLAEGASLLLGGTSRMNREVHVRICGRLGVQFPGPTRQEETEPRQTGLRRPGENLTNCHRETNVTAPLLDSTF